MKQGNFLEDFKPKKIFKHAIPRSINEGDVALYMGLTGNRNPLHCAHDFSRRLGFKNTPIDDILLFHIAFGRTVNDISLNAVANLGYADIQFKRNAYVGDTLRSESEVIGVKENSNKTTGIVYVHSKTFNQNNEEILSWIRWVMVPKRNNESVIETLIPENIPEISSINMIERENIDFAKTNTTDTGNEKLFEDYEIGEMINHSAGLTIDESDHTIATKLYQNNAKLHFDAHMMKDTPFKRRLIYGGHIISLCRSISFEGLENAIQIAGINSGIHSNPSFAGDTIYCKTEILDKFEHKNFKNAGVLRVRQIGIKNKNSYELKNIMTEKDGKKIYDPSVVLDLDYFVIIPKRK
jgi:2-methylfumaryl-CoA hydratase